MTRRGRSLSILALGVAVALAVGIGFAAGAASGPGDPSGGAPGERIALPGFVRAVFLSHVNDPAVIPGFPGDPRFSLRTAFTVPRDVLPPGRA